MENRHLDTARQKPWFFKLLESMDVAGEAIINFAKTRSDPQYRTAFMGFLALLGTMLPWTSAGGLGFVGQKFSHVGFTTLPGRVIAASALIIILAALFTPTRPGKANSPSASLVALIDLVIGCFSTYFVCIDCGGLVPSFGFGLSLVAIPLAFICGWLPNPKKQE